MYNIYVMYIYIRICKYCIRFHPFPRKVPPLTWVPRFMATCTRPCSSKQRSAEAKKELSNLPRPQEIDRSTDIAKPWPWPSLYGKMADFPIVLLVSPKGKQKVALNWWNRWVQDGAPKIAFSWLMFVAELTLVYGRYNELDNYGIHGGYKPTERYRLGGPILYSEERDFPKESRWSRVDWLSLGCI